MPRLRARAVALFLLGVVLLQGAWLVAVPPYYGTDEFDHAYRASSVALGHWGPGGAEPADGRGLLIPVADDVARGAFAACDGLDYPGSENCRPVTAPDADGQVLVASAAATYLPAWYAVVGTAARPFEGAAAVTAMRVTSLLLCDLLLAGALWLLLVRLRHPWAVAGLAVAATPTLVYSTATAAPNAVGYCGGALLWAGLLALPTAAPDDPSRDRPDRPGHALLGVTVGGVAVLTTHSTGVVWVVLALLCAAPLLRSRLAVARASRPRALGVAGAVLALTATASLVWVLAAGTNDPRDEVGAEFGPAPLRVLLQGLLLWPLQSIATLRLRGDPAPMAVYALGAALLLVLLVTALRAGDRTLRRTLLLVAAASLAVPLAATVAAHDQVGPAWQGRYGLALSVGVVLLAVSALAHSRTLPAWAPAVAVLVVATLHLLTLRAMLGEALGGPAAPVKGWWVVLAPLLAAGAWLAALRPATRLSGTRPPPSAPGSR